MDSYLRYFLLPYVVVIFFATFAWRSYVTWKRTGINPYSLGRSDNAHDFVGMLFRVTLVAILLVVSVYTFWHSLYTYVIPIVWLQQRVLQSIGITLLVLSGFWILVAQAQMGTAWRIGIDIAHATLLVRHGVFRWSRNPIFLGMRLTLLGLFLVLPTAVTLAILVVGDVLLQIQVRLEEAHLSNLHGEQYRVYMQQTRRWI